MQNEDKSRGALVHNGYLQRWICFQSRGLEGSTYVKNLKHASLLLLNSFRVNSQTLILVEIIRALFLESRYLAIHTNSTTYRLYDYASVFHICRMGIIVVTYGGGQNSPCWYTCSYNCPTPANLECWAAQLDMITAMIRLLISWVGVNQNMILGESNLINLGEGEALQTYLPVQKKSNSLWEKEPLGKKQRMTSWNLKQYLAES